MASDADPDVSEKRELACPSWESKPGASSPQPSNHTPTNYQMAHIRVLSTQQFTCYMRKNRDRINCSAISATTRTHTCANTHTDCPLSLTNARQLFLSKSLHPPGYPVTAAVFGTAIKDTSAREV